jgi:hypothetical protein
VHVLQLLFKFPPRENFKGVSKVGRVVMPGKVAGRRVNCKRPGDLLAVCPGLLPLRGTGWDNRCYPVMGPFPAIASVASTVAIVRGSGAFVTGSNCADCHDCPGVMEADFRLRNAAVCTT